MEQNKETWEERFDKLFYSSPDIAIYCRAHSTTATPSEVLAFISSELLLQRTNDVREILETLSAPEMHCTLDQTKALRIHAQGFNIAIDIIKDYLRIFAKEKEFILAVNY